MATGNASVGKITPRADEINAEQWALGDPMPEIKYFVPGYNSALVIEEGGEFKGMKTPWFLPDIPVGGDSIDYHNYSDPGPIPLVIDDIPDELRLKYDEGGEIKSLVCDVKAGRVTLIPRVGTEPTMIKMVLDKRVNEYAHNYTTGTQANVFYVLDENQEIVMIIHAHGLTFESGDKWEIVQYVVYQHEEPITSINEDPDPFHFRTAAELLLPDVIVGSDEDKLNGVATHNIADFSDPGTDLAGKRVLFLPTAGPLTSGVVKAGDDISLKMRDQTAALDLAGHTLTFSGNNVNGHLRLANDGAASLIIPGNSIDLAVQADNDDAADFTGDGIVVVNGNVNCRDVAVDGSLTVAGDSTLKVAAVDSLNVTDGAGGSGDLSVDGVSTLKGDLSVEGASTLKVASVDSLTVTKAAGGSGDAAVDGNLSVDGGSTLKAAAVDSLSVTKSAGGSGDAAVDGSLTVAGVFSADVLEANADIILGGRSLAFVSRSDRIVLTAPEQALYANSDHILRYDQATSSFMNRDGDVVADNGANPFPAGDTILIRSLETLNNNLYFKGDRLKIECERGSEIPLGIYGADNIPRAVFVKGDDCLVDLWLDKSMKNLKISMPGDKYASMSNGLDAFENRRVIKNQGKRNRIIYNNREIFRGREPEIQIGFMVPLDDPYCLEWDEYSYDATARSGNPSNNALKCWFWELYQALDSRFNPGFLSPPDTFDAWRTVVTPPSEAYFFRAPGADAPDRHERASLGVEDYIGVASYSMSGNVVNLVGGYKTHDIRKVRNGMRVQDDGLVLPGGTTGTTIVEPGSIKRGAFDDPPGTEYSFRLINAQTGAGEGGASGDLKLDFSGMAAGSLQPDAFQNITGRFTSRRASDDNPLHSSADGAFSLGNAAVTLAFYGGQNAVQQSVNFDASGSPGAKTSPDETRPRNLLIVPYYRL